LVGRLGVNLDDFVDFVGGFICYDRFGDDRGAAWGENEELRLHHRPTR